VTPCIPDFLLPLSAADQRAVDEGCYFDMAAAQKVRRFIERFLRHSKGKWSRKPFELCRWQWEQIIAPLFGWRRADGTRRYRRAYVEVPKKNGKSTLAAAILLYMLVADGESGAEVYSGAVNRKQAGIIFQEIHSMIRKSPALAELLRAVPHKKRIEYDDECAWYQSLSADAESEDGLNIHCAVIDELHRHKSRALFDVLKFGGAARDQPLTFIITTAGNPDEHSIGWQQHIYAKQIVDGERIDTSYFAKIYAADPEDDWKDPATWHKANPGLGDTLSLQAFRDDFTAALGNLAEEANFKRLRLNLWLHEETSWLPITAWIACRQPLEPFGVLEGRPCWGGLDMSWTTDLSAFVLAFPWPEDQSFSLLSFFWAPEDAFRERERRNRQRLDAWFEAGLIRKVPGAIIDHQIVLADVVELSQKYQILGINADPYNAVQLLLNMVAAGLQVQEFRQTITNYNGPMKEAEKAILSKKIRHDGNPVMEWMFKNMAVRTDAQGNRMPAKNKAPDKIDGIAAKIMAIGGCISNPAPSENSTKVLFL